MLEASIAFQVLPEGGNAKEKIRIIDKVIAMVQKSGINYEVGAMETTMEGNLETLFQIIKKAQYLCVKEGAKSVFTNVKIFYNPKGVMTIHEKVDKYR